MGLKSALFVIANALPLIAEDAEKLLGHIANIDEGVSPVDQDAVIDAVVSRMRAGVTTAIDAAINSRVHLIVDEVMTEIDKKLVDFENALAVKFTPPVPSTGDGSGPTDARIDA